MDEKTENVAVDEKMLVPTKIYLKAGVHIGAKFKTAGMNKYVFKKRPDRLKVLDVNTIDNRIRIAAKFIASFDPKQVVAISRKQYGQIPVKKFAEATGINSVLGRFIPGTFTNPAMKNFIEPSLIIVTDPNSDIQAIEEATKVRAPVIALCSTDSRTDNVDLIIPINNKGRQSLALVFWLLTREVLKERGEIKNNDEFKEKLEDFEFPLEDVKIQETEDRNKFGRGGQNRMSMKRKK